MTIRAWRYSVAHDGADHRLRMWVETNNATVVAVRVNGFVTNITPTAIGATFAGFVEHSELLAGNTTYTCDLDTNTIVFNFKTFPDPSATESATFMMGNCFDTSHDPGAGAIGKYVQDQSPDAFFFTGDTPYTNFVGTEWGITTVALSKTIVPPQTDFAEHHRLFIRMPTIKDIMHTVPTFNVIDDHELPGDDWDHRRTHGSINYATQQDANEVFINGNTVHRAFWSDQDWFRTSANADVPSQAQTYGGPDPGESVGTNYLPNWVQLRAGCVDVFITDCIGGKDPYSNADGVSKDMLGLNQMTDLKAWLSDSSTAVWKFIIMSKPAGINHGGELVGGDGWGNYQNQLGEILQYIEDNAITGVVFGGGDTHGPWYAMHNQLTWTPPGSSEQTNDLASVAFGAMSSTALHSWHEQRPRQVPVSCMEDRLIPPRVISKWAFSPTGLTVDCVPVRNLADSDCTLTQLPGNNYFSTVNIHLKDSVVYSEYCVSTSGGDTKSGSDHEAVDTFANGTVDVRCSGGANAADGLQRNIGWSFLLPSTILKTDTIASAFLDVVIVSVTQAPLGGLADGFGFQVNTTPWTAGGPLPKDGDTVISVFPWNQAAYTAGALYHVDITSQLQFVIDHANWVDGLVHYLNITYFNTVASTGDLTMGREDFDPPKLAIKV